MRSFMDQHSQIYAYQYQKIKKVYRLMDFSNPRNLKSIAVFFWLIGLALSFAPATNYEALCIGGSVLSLILACAISDSYGLKLSRWTISFSAPLICIGFLWLLSLASIAWAASPWMAYTQFWTFSLLPLSILFFTLNWDDRAEILHSTARAITLLLSAVAAFSLVQYYFMPQELMSGRAFYPLKNPNSLGAVFSLGFFCSLYLYNSGNSKALSLLAGALMIAGIATTGSRGASYALILSLLYLAFCFRHMIFKKNATSKRTGLFTLTGVFIFLIVSMTGTSTTNTVIGNTLRAGTDQVPLLWERPSIWKSTFEIIKDNPILGVGVGNFPLFYDTVRLPGEDSAGFSAHNDFLQLWSELGIAAPILILVLASLLIFLSWKALSQNETKNRKNTLYEKNKNGLVISIAALFAAGLHSLVTSLVLIAPAVCLLGYILAVWQNGYAHLISRKDVVIDKPEKLSASLAEAGIGVVFLGFICLVAPAFISNFYTDRATTFKYQGNMEEFVHAVNASEKWSLGQNPVSYIQAALLPVSILETDSVVLMKSNKEELKNEALDLLEKAQKLNPRDPAIYHRRARLYYVSQGDMDNATKINRSLKKALQIDPYFMPSRVWLLERYIDSGENDKAYTLVRESIPYMKIWQYNLNYASQAAQVLLSNGDTEEGNQLLDHIRSLQERR